MRKTDDEVEETDRWVLGDLRLSTVAVTEPFKVPCMGASSYGSVLHRPYRVVRQCCWYHSVDWRKATTVAAGIIQQALAQLAASTGPRPRWNAAVKESLPQKHLPPLSQAVESLAWGQPILASDHSITDGSHRLRAMRHQGVKARQRC